MGAASACTTAARWGFMVFVSQGCLRRADPKQRQRQLNVVGQKRRSAHDGGYPGRLLPDWEKPYLQYQPVGKLLKPFRRRAPATSFRKSCTFTAGGAPSPLHRSTTSRTSNASIATVVANEADGRRKTRFGCVLALSLVAGMCGFQDSPATPRFTGFAPRPAECG
jgi:hypothetical protein